MSGKQSTETSLTGKHFEFEVDIEDPDTGLVTTFPMEVDTGSPIALALPEHCASFFSDKKGTVDLGGAGSANSPAYSANILQIGNISLNYETMAVMTLSDTKRYGLLGIELLKYMNTEIYNQPHKKKLWMENTHL